VKFRALALTKPYLSATAYAVTAILSLRGMAPGARAGDEREADLPLRVSRLAAEVQAAEDVRAIKHLQRAYGFYLDKGMWEDLSQLFTADAVANYPAGIYEGKDSIRRHLFLNVGAVKLGEVGLGDGRLYNHMNIQPVVHLDPGGETAKGRWRALAMFGSYGGSAVWAEGVYELTYRKEGGVWKIHTLDYYSGFGAPYATGWIPPETPRAASGGARRPLAHPPDRERKMECDGFPAACIAPFHYDNPGRTAAAHAWIIADTQLNEQLTINRHANLRAVLADLSRRATRLEDEQTIENLQRIYGYYFDRAAWDQVADLFARDATLEMGLQGVYVGKQHLRRFLETLSPQGLSAGMLNDHIQLQTLVDIAPDGKTAYCRSRELAMTGVYGKGGAWSEGVYENTYVKDHGTWKFKSLHFYPTLSTDYDLGWARSALPAAAPSTTMPPDRPPSQAYNIYPKAFVPPYHYRNPVTGEVPHYPGADRGGPDTHHAAAALIPVHRVSPASPVKDSQRALADTGHILDRVESYEELENLESAYGYYLDKNLWNDLADLFARDGSMELAQRGVYRGQDHVRAFLLTVFGRGKEGPVAGRLGNHLQLQPVIDVAPDGRTAKIRSRMLQQMSLGGRASLGGAVYENEAVKEDGVWRFKTDHAYNTFSAGYTGGWAKSASRAMPGPSKDMPPDAPPTASIAMFPVVYDIPFHYANPVTGRTEVPPVRPAENSEVLAAMAASDRAVSDDRSARKGIPSGDEVGMPPAIAAALREIGPKIDGPRTAALYTPLLTAEPYAGVNVVRDVHYGSHERHVADVFTSSSTAQGPTGRSVVVFVHGGGFTRGSKHTPGSPFYDNIGVWAVRHGLVGVTINYRLAPQFQWPAGIEDLTLLTRWVRDHAHEYGGNPTKIFLWGHSAGAAHVADYLAHAVNTGADPGIAGAILTSGFYDLGGEVSIWKEYYGDDISQYAARSSLPGLLKTATPLLVTYAELDPDSFKSQTRGLIEARSREGRPVHSVLLAGHSHISETYAVGTGDESLSGPVLDFIQGAAGAAKGGSR
jgi:acetyl esterase/lipase